jgi:ribonuclease Y
MEILYYAAPAVACLIGGWLAASWKINSDLVKRKLDAQSEGERIKKQQIEEGKVEAAKLKAEEAEQQLKKRRLFEEELKNSQTDIKAAEKRLDKREDLVDRKLSLVERKEQDLVKLEEKRKELLEIAEQKAKELEKMATEERRKLEMISGLTPDRAKALLLERVERDCASEMAELTQRAVNRAKENSEREARNVILKTIQRIVPDVVAETTVTSIDISSDEVKGRVIGREGRNIRAFEKATGIDVIVDDTPGVIVLSGFEPVRREIARISMERLIQDGRIHPTRIEESVAKAEKEVMANIERTGRETAIEFGCHDLNPKLIDLLGRLYYRTSYGQRVLSHVREVARLSGLLAAELKLDVQLSKRCGLLHDIGKAMDQEHEGTHPQLGMEIAKQCDERQEVWESVGGHHGDIEVHSLYPLVVQIADAISASRPGARRESLERYVQRMQRLEEIAMQRRGIEKAFAIQAGREVRVLAKADQMNDQECSVAARDIAKQIEQELNYPGEVRITLIREARFIEYAR